MKIYIGMHIFNLIVHSILAMFMSFMAGIDIAIENRLGLIGSIISVGLWLVLIIFFDIKGIKRCRNNNLNEMK